MGRMLMKDKEHGKGTDRNSLPPGLMMWITDIKRTRAGPMGWKKTEISDTITEAARLSTGQGTIPETADWSTQRTKTTGHMIKGGKSGRDTVLISPRTPRNLGTTIGIGIIMLGTTRGIGTAGSSRKKGAIYPNLSLPPGWHRHLQVIPHPREKGCHRITDLSLPKHNLHPQEWTSGNED